MFRQPSNGRNDGAADEREVATVPRQLHFRERGDGPVDVVVHHPEQQPFFASRSAGIDDVGASFVVTDHLGNDLRFILEVTVHQHHRVAARVIERRAHGRLMAEIARQGDEPDPLITAGGLGKQAARPVGAAVVDKDDFMRPAWQLVQHAHQARHQFRNDFLFVVHGDAYREPHDRALP